MQLDWPAGRIAAEFWRIDEDVPHGAQAEERKSRGTSAHSRPRERGRIFTRPVRGVRVARAV